MKKITLTCPHCGGNQFVHPDNPNLESKVACSGCSTVSLVSDFANINGKEEAVRLAREMARATFGKMLK